MSSWYNILLILCVPASSTVLSDFETLAYEEPACDYPGVSIDLSNLGLKAIRKKLTSSTEISCLSLAENVLKNVSDDVFNELPNLSYLNLAGNCFRQNPFEVPGSIRTLVLDNALVPERGEVRRDRVHHCGIKTKEMVNTDLDRILELKLNWSSLEKLYLHSNELTGLIFENPGPNLTHLYLENNRLRSNNLSIPATVTHLFLSDNFINTFGQMYLEGLEVLVLDNNNITTLCITDRDGPCNYNSYDLALSRAGQLKVLSLAGNDIRFIEYFDVLNKIGLEYLDLSRNTAVAVPLITKFKNLRSLHLDEIGMSEVPDLAGLEVLETLTLKRNLIKAITAGSFQSLVAYQQLKHISLADNSISTIEPNAFDQLKLLEEINLSGNRLSILDASWLGSHLKLQCLRLDRNLFTGIKNMGLSSQLIVDYVNIADNPFELQTANDFQSLPGTSKVIMKRHSGSDHKASTCS